MSSDKEKVRETIRAEDAAEWDRLRENAKHAVVEMMSNAYARGYEAGRAFERGARP